MDWQEEYKLRVAGFPDDVRTAHDHSSNHRAEFAGSAICGCFCCCATFPPEQIEDWVHEVNGEGQTALCPKCGIDAVIGDRAGFGVSREFLNRMKLHWFQR